MKEKGEAIRWGRLLKYVLIGLLTFLGLVCLYNGSLFSGGLPRGDDSFDDTGADPVTGRFVVKKDFDELFEDEEHNPEVPKSIPVGEKCWCAVILRRRFTVFWYWIRAFHGGF